MSSDPRPVRSEAEVLLRLLDAAHQRMTILGYPPRPIQQPAQQVLL
jgi:hypothetical protein